MYFRIGALKYFAMFTGKHLCSSLFLMKMQAWRPATLLKRDSKIFSRFFPVKFARFLRAHISTEHIRWLLLELSHELSLYWIWEQWTVSFRGTYWLPSGYFILLDEFRFFLFLSFFLFFFFFFFLWILLLFGFELNLSIFKTKQWSCSKVSKRSLEA